LSRYSVAVDSSFANQQAAATLTPNSSVGVSITGYYVTHIDNGGVVREWSLARLTGGSVVTSQTPEKFSSRSRASGASGAVSYAATEPSISGNALVLLGEVSPAAAGAPLMSRKWTLPNYRYPIYVEPSSGAIGIFGSAVDTPTGNTRYITFVEPVLRLVGLKGRRSRNAGYFNITDEIRNFHGLSTGQKGIGTGQSHNYVQVADWPDTTTNSLVTFLNLLNGTADQSLDAGNQLLTITAAVATVSAGNSDIAAGGNVVTLSAPTATLSTAGAQNINAGDQVVTISAPNSTLSPGNANLAAGANVITITAPLATLSALIDLLAGTNLLTFSAPVVSLNAGNSNVPAGPNTVVFTAPNVTIQGGTATYNFWCGDSGVSGITGGGDIEELDVY
jgi:hypothetical protein